MNRRAVLGAGLMLAVAPCLAKAQPWTHAVLSNLDFEAALPVSFDSAQSGDDEAARWTLSAPDGRPFVGIQVSATEEPPADANVPVGAQRLRGHRWGRDYWLHVWTYDLPPEDATLARRIADTVRARG